MPRISGFKFTPVCPMRSTMVALWPVYGLLTPAIVLLLFMGLIMSTHFIPMP